MTDRIVIPTAKDDVVLRQLILEDCEAFEALADTNRMQIQGYLSFPRELSDDEFAAYKTIDSALPDELRFGIWEAEIITGFIRIVPRPGMHWHGVVGYWVGSEFTQRGLATLAVRALSTFAIQELNFKHLCAWVLPENIWSQKVLMNAAYFKTLHIRGLLEFRRDAS